MNLEQGNPLHVDHVNRNKLDNRKGNLRIVTLQENMQNRGKYKSKKDGLPTGVSWNLRVNKFKAVGYHEGKSHFLGLRDTIEEAEALVIEFNKTHKKFSADNDVTCTFCTQGGAKLRETVVFGSVYLCDPCNTDYEARQKEKMLQEQSQ